MILKQNSIVLKIIKFIIITSFFLVLGMVIRQCSNKKVEWYSIQSLGLYTLTHIQFQTTPTQATQIQQRISSFLHTYDSTLSNENINNTFFKISKAKAYTTFKLNPIEYKLITFIEDQNKQYTHFNQKTSPFQIGVGEWLYRYGLNHHINSSNKLLTSTKKEITQILSKPYYEFNKKQHTLTSFYDSLHFTIGGVSKGYGITQIANILKKYKVKNYLINAGGDLSFYGLSPKDSLWKIGIRNPFVDSNKYSGIIQITCDSMCGLATSGGYENKKENKHHIINPITGESISNKSSVTVIAKNALWADFYATFIYLLPIDEAILFAQKTPLLEVMIISPNKQYFITPGFKKHLQEKPKF